MEAGELLGAEHSPEAQPSTAQFGQTWLQVRGLGLAKSCPVTLQVPIWAQLL